MKRIYWFLILIAMSCENPFEDFTLGFKEPVEEATVRIQFNLPENGKLPADFSLQVSGRDADKIITNLGSTTFKVSREGILILAVRPEYVPSVSEPVMFTVTARASGYQKVIREFVMSNSSNRNYQARLLKNELKGNLSTTQFKISKEKQFELSDGSDKVIVRFSDKSIFRNRLGEPVNEDLDLVLQKYKPLIAKSNLPDGGVAARPVDRKGVPLQDSFDFTQLAGLVSAELSSVGNNVVKHIDPAAVIEMEIPSDQINPVTGKAVAVGDLLDVVSIDKDSGIWTFEGQTKVYRNARGWLAIDMDVAHLSWWMAGWRRLLCRTGPVFVVQSNQNDLDISYLYKLTDAKSNKVIREQYMSLNNGSRLALNNLPRESELVRLQIFRHSNYHDGDRTTPWITSSAVPLCGNSTIGLPAINIKTPDAVEIELVLKCPSGFTLDPESLPSQMRVQFSEVDKAVWRDAGVVRREQVRAKTYRLKMGNRYDIRASSDGGVTWPFQQKNQLINKKKWPIDVKVMGGKCS